MLVEVFWGSKKKVRNGRKEKNPSLSLSLSLSLSHHPGHVAQQVRRVRHDRQRVGERPADHLGDHESRGQRDRDGEASLRFRVRRPRELPARGGRGG